MIEDMIDQLVLVDVIILELDLEVFVLAHIVKLLELLLELAETVELRVEMLLVLDHIVALIDTGFDQLLELPLDIHLHLSSLCRPSRRQG